MGMIVALPMLSFRRMTSRSLKHWFESGMSPGDFPEIPSDTEKRTALLHALIQRLAGLPEDKMTSATGVIPGLLADRIPIAEIINSIDSIDTDNLSPQKNLLLGEFALDFLILDEKWSECIPRIDRLLDIARDAGLIEELAILFNYRGVCLYRLARYSDAQSDLEESLKFADEAGSDLRRARARSNLGLVMKEMGRLDDAAGHYKIALSLARDIGDNRSVRAIYLNIGNIYKELGRWDDGIRALEKGIDLAHELGEIREEIRGRLNLGVLLLEKGDRLEDALALFERVIDETSKTGADQLASIARENAALVLVRLDHPDESLEYSRRTLDEAEKDNDVEGIWRSLANMGRAYSKLGKTEPADTNFRKALDKFSKLRGTLVSDRDRSEYQRNLRDLQTEYIEHSIGNHPPHIAFARLAVNKSRALLQSRDSGSSKPLQQHKDGEILDLIQKKLAQTPGTAIVDYFLSPSGLYILVCDENSVSLHQSQVTEEEIDALLRELVAEINLFIASREYRDAEWNQNSTIPEPLAKLGGILIQPVMERLSGIKELVIVPHGILHRTPFAALGTSEGIYLIEQFSISSLPSSDFILDEKSGVSAEDKIIILKGSEENLEGIQREIESLREIASDRIDVIEPADILGRDGLEGLGRLMTKASVIHFSGHAEFDRSDPYLSALLLHDGTRISVRDLLATGVDLRGTRLVSLAGCETGMGIVLRGDEVIGIARAFVAAGAGAALVSLWKVSDEATAILMPEFYKAWMGGASASEALRQAMLSFLCEKRRHPYFFAPFQLIGG